MTANKARKIIRNRMETVFESWGEAKSVTEKELYSFLQSISSMAEAAGMESLFEFATKQLHAISPDHETKIPSSILSNFKQLLLNRSFEPADGRNENTGKLKDTFILLIDDDMNFISDMKETLEMAGAQVIVALDGKRGIEQFYSMRPSFILMETELPDMSGFDVLQRIGETALSKNVSILMMSKTTARDNWLQTYRLGGQDLFPKPIDIGVFLPFLVNRNERRKIIEQLTIKDGLTGAGNRRNFDEALEHAAEQYKEKNTPFTLVLLDLDHFKRVNDVYGHPVGDDVLQTFGRLLVSEKREKDTVYRYGGEEFAIIMPEACAEEAAKMIGKLREHLQTIPFRAGSTTFSITFSAGAAAYAGEGAEGILAGADQALYEAKRTGRNRTVIFNEGQSRRRQLEVIIVDDDRLIRTILHDTLSELKQDDIELTVRTFADGPSFLAADWYSPDKSYIILLDGIMPGMDGLEVLGRIKKDGELSNVVVSMMTARTKESDMKAALWFGADDYITKPFLPEEILERIRNLAARMFNKG